MTEEGYDAAIERRNAQTKDIFEQAAKETIINHTMVGVTPQSPVTQSLYNPHNYRLYFSFTKTNFKPSEGMVGVWFCKKVNSGKEFSAVGEGVRITIRKVKAEIIHKYSEEEWFSINKLKSKEEIQAILNKIDERCINSFKKFIEIFGGETDYKILSSSGRPFINLLNQGDHKIMHEEYIDSLPLKMQFETPIVKKAYNKSNVEFSEGIYAAQHLENSALNNYGEIILNRLKIIEKTQDILVPFTEQLRVHLEVENRTNELLKLLIEKESGVHGASSKAKAKDTPLQPCTPSKYVKVPNIVEKLQMLEKGECYGFV